MPKSDLAKSSVWAAALRSCADPARARHVLELAKDTAAADLLRESSAERARILCAVFSGSQALSTDLIAHPEWFELLTQEKLKFPRRKEGLSRELEGLLEAPRAQKDYAAALRQVRELKRREMVRIGTRDLARLARVPEITLELSDLADACLGAVWEICREQMEGRHGSPYHLEPSGRWQVTPACVLGMGKLGGQELNYSSDVDLMFVYSAEGGAFREKPVKPKSRPPLSNHQFFNRLAEAFIGEVTRTDSAGTLHRIDMRLRPEGDGGPLSRSLESYENYYAQWGQTWERMMLIKARPVAGNLALGAEFLETVQPFRYPRSLSQGVLREVAAMKDRIENEVLKSDELDRNVKLGRGGIREVEFVVQALQLLHAGRQPFLQETRTLPALEKLVQYELLAREDAHGLAEAYCFLREVEHRLQMEDNHQTHTLPVARAALERVARLMDFDTVASFEKARGAQTATVRAIFDKLLKAEKPEAEVTPAFPQGFEGAETEWKRILAENRFCEPEKACRVLREFVEGPGYVHVSPRTRELALGLLQRLFALCRPRSKEGGARSAVLSDPDRVITRLDSFITAYGARGTLFELWHSSPRIFDLLVLLFDRSEFLAELAIRTPDLVDELVTSGRLRQRKSASETLRDLRHGVNDEDQHLWLRRYHHAELMRIGLRDILGLADPEQYLTELSALAEACVQYALEAVMKRHKLKKPPFAIIGLGKLGGAEIDYGSDLDLVFVADNRASDVRKLRRMAVEFTDLMSKRTEDGIVFHTDARLRPDGEKGLLVNTLKAYEDYYRQRGLLWEIQSLTRARPLAGDSKIGGQFEELAVALANFARPSLPLAGYTPDWKLRIHQMRMRIEKERTPAGKEDLAIKTGAGGLIDAEFVAQALCLEHGWHEPNTMAALEHGRAAWVLPEAEVLIENYRRLRRVEGILRRWSYEGEIVLPDDPAPYLRVAIRCGFKEADEFHSALAGYRAGIRGAYEKVFQR